MPNEGLKPKLPIYDKDGKVSDKKIAQEMAETEDAYRGHGEKRWDSSTRDSAEHAAVEEIMSKFTAAELALTSDPDVKAAIRVAFEKFKVQLDAKRHKRAERHTERVGMEMYFREGIEIPESDVPADVHGKLEEYLKEEHGTGFGMSSSENIKALEFRKIENTSDGTAQFLLEYLWLGKRDGIYEGEIHRIAIPLQADGVLGKIDKIY